MSVQTTSNTDLIASLRAQIEGDVLTDAYSLGMYATDASFYQIMPLAVVLPKDDKEVLSTVRFCQTHKLNILPRGAGTSLAGQTVGEAVIIDFSKYMNNIIELNVEEHWVRVQPGLVRDELNEYLLPYGLHFSPDPATSSRANIGGMIGNNSSGTKSILYGKTVDHILEVRVLLADGTELLLNKKSPEAYDQIAATPTREGNMYKAFKELIQTHQEEIKSRFPKVMRRVGGYNLDEFVYTNEWNLAKLITGSEGTLAVTLEVKINLDPLPKYKSVVVAHFHDLLEAIQAVPVMLQYHPSAVEILDKVVLELSAENLTTRHHCHFIQGSPAAIQIVEFYGNSATDVLERPQAMIERLQKAGIGYAYPLFPSGKEYEDVWALRRKSFGLMLGLKSEKKALSFIEDSAIPIDHLAEYIEQVLAICKKHNTEVSMYAHASVGVIHVQPLLDLRNEQDIKNLKHITDETFELVVKYGGSWSGEHGDGLVRSAYNERFFGKTLYGVFKEVKHLFDPDYIMNPGKIIDAQPIDHHLRYGTQYKDSPVSTMYHYRSEHSFGDSVHMCTGVGECRKMLGGTMCPSFKVTRDEEHSTRGRANALRLAMSNQLDRDGLSSQRLHEVMDLCLSCKACKSECPSNVDMAKMKSDVAQIYYDQHGTSVRDRLIKNSSAMAARLSGSWAGIINFIQSSTPFRYLLEKIAGFDKRKKLPAYSTRSLTQWWSARKPIHLPRLHKVVLFADTYINYHEPHIGIAAVELLESCGYEVQLVQAGCCQRPKISHGFLREAKSEGTQTLQALKQYMDQGLYIVVCEPSCASALNDDLPDLIDDETLANQAKKYILPIDEFIHAQVNEGHISPQFVSITGDVLIHGHCHQKALFGTQAMKFISSQTGQQVAEIPSGCCGMAGSFGYEKEHFDISQKIGEQVLMPAVRNKKKETTMVANGFSCRHQIEHFTGVKAKHWVETIRGKG